MTNGNGLLAGTDIQRQIELERRAQMMGESEHRDELHQKIMKGQASSLPAVYSFFSQYLDDVRQSIKDAKNNGAGKPFDTQHAFFLQTLGTLSSRVMAAVSLNEIVNVLMRNPEGVTATMLYYRVWKAVRAQLLLRLAEQYDKSIDDITARVYPKIVKRWRRATPNTLLGAGSYARQCPELWPTISKHYRSTMCGSMLVWAVVHACLYKADDETEPVPVFRFGKKHEGKKTIMVVWIDYSVQAKLHNSLTHDAALHPQNLPLLAEPLKWGFRKRGGRYTIRKPLVVRATKNQREYMANNDMPMFYRAVNWFGASRFRINKKIKGVQDMVWDGGRDHLDIPAQVPLEESEFPRATAATKEDKDLFAAHRKHLSDLYKANIERTGRRTVFAGMYTVAGMFGEESFHFDQCADFRGRFYTRSDYLNYLNDKPARAMLEFAKPVELGEHGREDLMVWAANCYGMDKLSLKDRVQWTLDHSREIARSAVLGIEEPFWQNSPESPWEFLAACHALTDDEAAMRLPIGKDGTANGLQHLAAMTRDETLASLVNLTDSDTPNDIYKVALAKVREIIDKNGVVKVNFTKQYRGYSKVVSYTVRPDEVHPYILRTICKQTFLAFPYGVTTAGAIRQVYDKMVKAGCPDDDQSHKIAIVLAKACIAAIESIAKRPAAAMAWMKECAKLVCTGEDGGPGDVALSWTNGVGFFVEQPYRQEKRIVIETVSGWVHLKQGMDALPVNRKAQIRGAAPNITHSFDSEHLVRTACAMESVGYEMFAQHDQYNCHVGHVRQMHSAILKQFHAQYANRNRLAELHAQWSKLRPDIQLPEPPEMGSFDMDEVLRAKLMFH